MKAPSAELFWKSHPLELDGEAVSPELLPHLVCLGQALARVEEGKVSVKEALVNLFTFLSSQECRTHANCCFVDSFLWWFQEETEDWEKVPEDIHEIFGMADALHDTVSAPEVAINFNSTPEALLKLAEALPDS